jgi:hypothetical protein
MSDTFGGERPLPPSQLSSPLLRSHGHAMAEHCSRLCYETWPELVERFGARGRHHIVQDAYWHLEHLDAAATAGEPAIFAEYADWLVGLLEARAIGREQVAGAFGFLAEALEVAECPADREPHRVELLAVLRANSGRILATTGAASAPKVSA